MDIQSRHFGPISTMRSDGTIAEVDVEALINRLVLFDVCYVESHSLKEIPALVSAFGTAGLLKLIYAGALVFICDVATTGQTGQTNNIQETTRRRGILPLGSFHLVNVQLAKGQPYRDEYVAKSLKEVDAAGVGRAETSKLKMALRSRMLEYPQDASQVGLGDVIANVLRGDVIVEQAIRRSALMQTHIDPGASFDYQAFPLDGDGEFRITTNFGRIHGFSEEVEHKVVERGVLAVAGLNQRVQLMRSFEALTGFKDDDAVLLNLKLSFLASDHNARAVEARFGRVVTLGHVSPTDRTGSLRVNVDRLLRYRNSGECAEFRTWLKDLDKRSDDEIAHEFLSVRKQMALSIGSPLGKAIRFVLTTVAGAVPVLGAIAGPLLSATDSFLVERIVGRPGPTAYLGRQYPAIFRK
ncbi:hypothetical protein QN345_03490 [Cryobacterium sp. 10I1]|uniref:hypothetical protein n=1 Tax=unclassified Cryobacterium TaxID=2649013 RepID=UPI002AB4E237|nr:MULTISPECIES: hypothetical protein [unclassified Cryobacterium]MDY7540855.1 hypothetical protein [Cryobacterium sp. 5B3]MEA9999819.1 hypothetical protein [Cryobacterium sp. RTS3]MEB0203727.1 hypothetical protein [Cryobacterium sp. 5I3]MEB0266606.1 hypothetical protein [Cryobacterium sp. 10I5]MEB0275396.1 hypothetical protein [Cryobacterium sp. 5B3]